MINAAKIEFPEGRFRILNFEIDDHGFKQIIDIVEGSDLDEVWFVFVERNPDVHYVIDSEGEIHETGCLTVREVCEAVE